MRDHQSRPTLPEDTRAARREDILMALEFALMSCRWKLGQGGESGHKLQQAQEYRRRAAALHILEHLERADYRIGQGPPRQPHG